MQKYRKEHKTHYMALYFACFFVYMQQNVGLVCVIKLPSALYTFILNLTLSFNEKYSGSRVGLGSGLTELFALVKWWNGLNLWNVSPVFLQYIDM